jgi:hypothetical protein
MICDKCDGDVEPQNNAKLYDAALSALVGNKSIRQPPTVDIEGNELKIEIYNIGYQPVVDAVWAELPQFRKEEIVHDDPVQSVQNVMKRVRRGRHLYATGECEGSPSRRRNIEEGVWGDGRPMGEFADLATRAYQVIQEIEVPIISGK